MTQKKQPKAKKPVVKVKTTKRQREVMKCEKTIRDACTAAKVRLEPVLTFRGGRWHGAVELISAE